MLVVERKTAKSDTVYFFPSVFILIILSLLKKNIFHNSLRTILSIVFLSVWVVLEAWRTSFKYCIYMRRNCKARERLLYKIVYTFDLICYQLVTKINNSKVFMFYSRTKIYKSPRFWPGRLKWNPVACQVSPSLKLCNVCCNLPQLSSWRILRFGYLHTQCF